MIDTATESAQLQIGSATLDQPLGVAPMAGMTDSAFRRLVKRQGGCGREGGRDRTERHGETNPMRS